jgi:TonB family protein
LGTVILKLWIGDAGQVVSVEIEDSQVSAAAAAAAAAAFAQLRFAPGEINGQAVGAIMRIEVTYDSPPPELPPTLFPALPPTQKN